MEWNYKDVEREVQIPQNTSFIIIIVIIIIIIIIVVVVVVIIVIIITLFSIYSQFITH